MQKNVESEHPAASQDDKEAGGGYLVLIANAPELSAPGHDSWVESRAHVDDFFIEAAWKIDWL